MKDYKIIDMQNATHRLLAILFICTACGSSHEQTGSERKPNIIYILADDMGYGDLSCYGQEKFETPNIDRLAAEGMLFTQHYSGSTVCAPSRATLMTGLHTGHTYVRGNRGMPGGQYPLPDSAFTLSEMLKKAGYVTGAFGKWGLGFPGSEGEPVNQGFDEFFGYISQTIAHNYYPWSLWHNTEEIILEGNEGDRREVYAPNLIQEKRLAFIETNKDTLFFMYMPSIIPHAELAAPEAYIARFLEKSSPEPNFELTSRFAPEMPYRGVDDVNHPRYKIGGYGSQAYPRATFAAMITLLDEHVGEIMDKIKALGLEENTLIIFSSDNGPHKEGGADPWFFNSNGPFKGHKRDAYEGAIRVPMIARWPDKITPGSKSDHISAFWDVVPTLADVAGVEKPAGRDGISFLPALLGEAQQEHPFLYWEFHAKRRQQAVRKGSWKAIRTLNAEYAENAVELYNLDMDLGEEKNVADQHPEIVNEMLEIMEQSHVEHPDWPYYTEKR